MYTFLATAIGPQGSCEREGGRYIPKNDKAINTDTQGIVAASGWENAGECVHDSVSIELIAGLTVGVFALAIVALLVARKLFKNNKEK